MQHIERKEWPRPTWLLLFYFVFWLLIGLIPSQIISMYAVSPFFNSDPDFVGQALSNPELAKGYSFGLTLFQGLSSVLAFVLVPFVFLKVVEKKSWETLSESSNNSPSIYLWTFVLVFLSFPVLSFLIEWNENISLPDSLKQFEYWARERELQMQAYTDIMTDFSNPAQLVLGFVVIALIAGLWEEFVFRGMIQRLLFDWLGNIHVAIWLSAFVFSAIHFQFFGFFPRLVLGALFGYLYYWSKDIFIPVLAHSINNGFTVLMMYLWQKGYVAIDIESVGSVSPPALLLSVLIFSLAIYQFRKKCFTNFN